MSRVQSPSLTPDTPFANDLAMFDRMIGSSDPVIRPSGHRIIYRVSVIYRAISMVSGMYQTARGAPIGA
jgi:hypothetical protein